MDLIKRKEDLELARDRAAAQLNAILGQLQLVNELLGETKETPINELPIDDGEKSAADGGSKKSLDS